MSIITSHAHGSAMLPSSPRVRFPSFGFARVSSHPALGYTMSPDQAFSVLRSFLADARHHFVSDDLSCTDRAVHTDLMAGANQITDHYLVALARHHHLTLATFDEALAKTFGNESGLVQLVR